MQLFQGLHALASFSCRISPGRGDVAVQDTRPDLLDAVGSGGPSESFFSRLFLQAVADPAQLT